MRASKLVPGAVAGLLLNACGEDELELPAGGCRTSEDCGVSSASCSPPGASGGCGIQRLPDPACSTDDECKTQGEHYICVSDPCVSGQECRAGCTDNARCGEAQVCGSDYRCEPQPCSATSPCPVNYDCAAQDSTCVRRSCPDDGVCDGYCVLQRCYGEPGICQTPTP